MRKPSGHSETEHMFEDSANQCVFALDHCILLLVNLIQHELS